MSTPTIAVFENPKAVHDKRFLARHYNYRDYYSTTTGADPTAAAASYIFGAAARAVNNRNWPMLGDTRQRNELPAQNTYARSIMIQCTEDANIIISSINPRYLRLYTRYVLEEIPLVDIVRRLANEGITVTITEVPMFIPANALLTFYPTMGYAITFYQNTASGTIRIWSEGNQEGVE